MYRLLFVLTLFCNNLLASQLDVADLHFKERHLKTYDELVWLRDLYEQISNEQNLSESEEVYAVVQTLKMDVIIGDYLPELETISQDKINSAMNHCLNFSKRLERKSRIDFLTFQHVCEAVLIRPQTANPGGVIFKQKYQFEVAEIVKTFDRQDIWPFLLRVGETYIWRPAFLPGGAYYFWRVIEGTKHIMNASFVQDAVIPPYREKIDIGDLSLSHFLIGKTYLMKGFKTDETAHYEQAMAYWKMKIEEYYCFSEQIENGELDPSEFPHFNNFRLENRAMVKRMERFVRILKPCEGLSAGRWYSCYGNHRWSTEADRLW